MKNVSFSAAGARLLVAGFLVSATGCVENDILIRVKPDGSGQIVVSRAYMPATVARYDAQAAQIRQSMKAMGDRATNLDSVGLKAGDDPTHNEKALKSEASLFGPDVAFVKSAKYEMNGARGSVAVYAFKDINKVFLNFDRETSERLRGPMQMRFSMGEEEDDLSGPPARSEESLGFKFTRGEVGSLRILFPAGFTSAPPESAETEEEEDGADDEFGYSSGRRYSMSYAGTYTDRQDSGARLSIAVEAVGEVTRATASHPDNAAKGRFFLLDMNWDRMAAAPGHEARQSSLYSMLTMQEDGSSFLSAAARMPGVIAETNTAFEVQFK